MKILINSNPIALWHDIIHDAEATCSIPLNHELEAYLVFLMVRYTNKPEVAKAIIANEFLQNVAASFNQKQLKMQEVGDKCLIFSGLFPKLADKRHVKISYYVNLGQTAYSTISQDKNDLYDSLAHQFVSLMDILQSIRQYTKEMPDLLPLQAYELWNETGSQRALNVLKQFTSGTPIGIHAEKFDK